jgi:hypothetical protein
LKIALCIHQINIFGGSILALAVPMINIDTIKKTIVKYAE